MPPTEISSARLQPLTWSTWFAWIFACALVPVGNTIAATAVGKQISKSAEYATLIGSSLVVVFVLAMVIPTLIQGLVLKRVLPRLSVTVWSLCIMLSVALWLALMFSAHRKGLTLIQAGVQTQSRLQSAAAPLRWGALNLMQMLALPWGPFLLWTLATSALMSLLPAAALGIAARLWRAAPLFFIASIAGTLASAILEQLYGITYDDRLLREGARLNGLSWTDRFHVLAARAGVGAVWGASTAIVVMRMAPQGWAFVPYRAGGSAFVLLAPLLLALLAPFIGCLAGPRGLIAGAPELRWALSFAPARDSSRGETVLAYSHDAAVLVAPRSAAAIAPDGRSAFVRTVDHTLMQIDLATGQTIRQLAGPLGRHERHAIVWSPDGRYLALRTDGADAQVSHIRSRSRPSQTRLYTLPDLTPAGEFWDHQGACLTSYARETMLFSSDSKSLWLLCGVLTAAKPDDPMAVRLDVPAMQIRETRRYGPAAESGPVQGLQRIGDSVWTWQFPSVSLPFRIRDLTLDRDVVTLALPLPEIGGLTPQNGNSELTEKRIALQFCGTPPGVAENGPASWICRTLTFDSQTGALLGSIDKPDHRATFLSPDRPISTLSDHGLRIEGFWRADSKTGELVVRDRATGRERQRIVSIAQRPLQISADGAWLMTVTVYGNGLRLYRVHP